MDRRKRIPALFLALCLALSLMAGCGRTPAAEPEATAEPTQEEIAEALRGRYREAAEALAGADKLRMEVSVTREYTTGADTLAEALTRTAEYEHYGEDTLRAYVSDLLVIGGSRAACELFYADGIEYAKVKQARFYSRTDAGRFLAEQIPAVLLDESLYGGLGAEETEDGLRLSFSEPLDGESWAMPQGGTLLEAAGAALLDGEGRIVGFDYEIRYRFGGSLFHSLYAATVDTPETMSFSAEFPDNGKGYESLDSVSAAVILFRARCALENASVVTAAFNELVYSEAASYQAVITDEISLFGQGGDFIAAETADLLGSDYDSGESYRYHEDYTYADGSLSLTNSAGEEESYTVPAQDMRDVYMGSFLDAFPSYSELQDASLTDLGEFYLIEFTASEDFGKTAKGIASSALFGSDNYLDGYATGYRTTKIDGYLAVEKDSCLPTALALDYSGVHTIGGEYWELEMQLSMRLSLYDLDTYEKITGESAPDEEPETKATPLLYKVTGAGGETLYLFGTIHVGDDRTAFLPQAVLSALDETEALAVEFDTDSFYESAAEDESLLQMLAESLYYTDGTGISNHIDSELYKRAVPLMKAAGQYGAASDYMRAYVWSSLLDGFYLSQGRLLSSSKGVDARLLRLAREREMEILDVESGEFQVRLMAEYSDEVQEMLLAESVSCPRSAYLEELYELYELWCGGDEQTLIGRLASLSEEERARLDEDELRVYDEYNQKMRVERNEAMTQVALSYLESGRAVFYAVGLAHLLGEGGLVEALRAAGYTVTLVDTH